MIQFNVVFTSLGGGTYSQVFPECAGLFVKTFLDVTALRKAPPIQFKVTGDQSHLIFQATVLNIDYQPDPHNKVLEQFKQRNKYIYSLREATIVRECRVVYTSESLV